MKTSYLRYSTELGCYMIRDTTINYQAIFWGTKEECKKVLQWQYEQECIK